MINIGVAGCGYWGANLVRNFHEISKSKLWACCDPSPERLERIKTLYPGVVLYQNYDDLIKDKDVQGVVLATPPATDYGLARKALLAGKDVFVEKPITLNSGQAEELVALAEKQERILMVGHVFLYNPAVVKLKEYIRQGDLGKIYYLYSTRVNLGRVRTDVNAMWNLAPHDISIMMYLLDDAPVAVSARGVAYLQPNVPDVVFLLLTFSAQRVGHIHVSWLDPSKKRTTTVVGTQKMVIYDDVDPEAKLKVYDKGVTMQDAYDTFGEFQFKLRSGDIYIPKIELREPIKLECLYFLECIETRRQPLTDGRNGLLVVRVLEAAQESLDKGGVTVEVKY